MPLPQLPEYLLVPLMIMVLGWGICVLMLLISFKDYVRKTNRIINKLYQELEQSPNDRETVQMPEVDMDHMYW